jgi:hypothetical protein
MTAGTMSFYVNGELIGMDGPASEFRYANRYCVDLLPSFNVFAVNASANGVESAATIAAIRVTYDDFTTDNIVTNTAWVTHPWVAGFEQLDFDDSACATAIVKVAYPGAPYDTVAIASDPPTIPLISNMIPWIWTNAIPASGTIPKGSRALRRTFTPMPGQVPASANIIITADDSYTLWVNNVEIGSGRNFHTAQHYTINFVSAPSEIVFAVLATNASPGAAGVLFAAEINMAPSGRANCIAGAYVNGDGHWVSTLDAIPTGWQDPAFDDSTWPRVASEAKYPAAPWDTVTVAAALAPVDV